MLFTNPKMLFTSPISLTPIISKLAEEIVVNNYVRPAVMENIDDKQFGTIPNSSTTHALISMLHAWTKDTDGNGFNYKSGPI